MQRKSVAAQKIYCRTGKDGEKQMTALAERIFETNDAELFRFYNYENTQVFPKEVFLQIDVEPFPINEGTQFILDAVSVSPSFDFLKEEY